jgi:hypothetical protein
MPTFMLRNTRNGDVLTGTAATLRVYNGRLASRARLPAPSGIVWRLSPGRHDSTVGSEAQPGRLHLVAN